MKKTLIIRKLLEASPSLRRIAVQEIPGKAAFRMAQIIRAADQQIEIYEEQHARILRKHCTEEKPGLWKAKNAEEKAAYDAEVKEIQEIECEMEVPECSIPLDEVKISGYDVIALDGLITFTGGEEDTDENDHNQREE